MSTLYQLRMNKGLSQQEVADLLQMSRVNYTNIENGKRNLTKDNALRLAQLFNVSVDALFGRNDEAADTSNPSPSFGRPIEIKPELVPENEIFIPLVCSLRCGFDSAGDPFTFYKKFPVPKSYVSKWGKQIVAVEAAGKSMMPTIRPRDILICIPGSAWFDNQIVVVDINDSDTIKRIFRSKDGGIDLVPDNEEFEPVHYTPEDLSLYQVHVLARVVKVIGPDL